MSAATERCPGCGGAFAPMDGPVHAYMTSSPACWDAFGQLLAAEYSSYELMAVHRLTVDCYAVQHPGNPAERRAVQSVGLHLARLSVQMEGLRPPDETNEVMLDFARHKATLMPLPQPARFHVTVDQVAPHAGTDRHAEKVRQWAQATWEDWAHVHAQVRDWVSRHSRHGA